MRRHLQSLRIKLLGAAVEAQAHGAPGGVFDGLVRSVDGLTEARKSGADHSAAVHDAAQAWAAWTSWLLRALPGGRSEARHSSVKADDLQRQLAEIEHGDDGDASEQARIDALIRRAEKALRGK